MAARSRTPSKSPRAKVPRTGPGPGSIGRADGELSDDDSSTSRFSVPSLLRKPNRAGLDSPLTSTPVAGKRSSSKIKFDLSAPPPDLNLLDDDDDLLTDDESDAGDPPEVNVVNGGHREGIPPVSYEHFLKTKTREAFSTIKQLIRMSGPADVNRNVFGVVTSVIDQQLYRVVCLNDPSDEVGVKVKLPLGYTILTGNILKIRDLRMCSNMTYDFEFIKDLANKKLFLEIRTFTYDYESGDGNEPFSVRHFLESFDRDVCHYIEKWISGRIMKRSFSNMPRTVRSYFDFACMVLAHRKMVQSSVLTVWDGTTPNCPISDPFNPVNAPPSEFEGKINHEYLPFALGKYAFVNVWKNESNMQNDHHDVATSQSLCNGNDLLIVYNIEVAQSISPDERNLVMRSGRHRGKCIRPVSRASVAGRLLMKRINAAVKEAQERPNLNQEVANVASTSTGHQSRGPPAEPTVPQSARTGDESGLQTSSAANVRKSPLKTMRVTEVQIDLSDEDKERIKRLPLHFSMRSMLDKDMDQLRQLKRVVEATNEDSPEQLGSITTEDLLEIIDLVIVARQNNSEDTLTSFMDSFEQ